MLAELIVFVLGKVYIVRSAVIQLSIKFYHQYMNYYNSMLLRLRKANLRIPFFFLSIYSLIPFSSSLRSAGCDTKLAKDK